MVSPGTPEWTNLIFESNTDAATYLPFMREEWKLLCTEEKVFVTHNLHQMIQSILGARGLTNSYLAAFQPVHLHELARVLLSASTVTRQKKEIKSEQQSLLEFAAKKPAAEGKALLKSIEEAVAKEKKMAADDPELYIEIGQCPEQSEFEEFAAAIFCCSQSVAKRVADELTAKYELSGLTSEQVRLLVDAGDVTDVASRIAFDFGPFESPEALLHFQLRWKKE
ncbi:Hypothetical protein POVN_LOCUS141 [uncultured virus]|nr:Hypothetical protein POVN_LOCUS141 [uncultured virus]